MYPYLQMGVPLLANPLYALLYPLNVLYLLFEHQQVFQLQLLLHYVLTGLGFSLLLGLLTRHQLFSCLASTMFLGSGLVWSLHFHPGEMETLPWIALAVYCQLRAIIGVTRYTQFGWATAGGIFATFIFNAGDPFAYGFAFILVVLMAWSFRDRFGVPHLMRKLFTSMVLAVVLSTVLILPQLLEGMQLFPFTDRGLGFGLRESLSYSTHFVRILDVISPWLLPALSDPEYPWPELRYGISVVWWYPSLALGIIASTCFVLGAGVSFKSRRGRMLLLLGFTIATLALGRHLRFGDLIWTYSPGLSTMRFPERLVRYAAVALLPILAQGLPVFFALLQKFTILRPRSVLLLVLSLSLVEMNIALPEAFLASHSQRQIPADLSFLQNNARVHVCKNSLPETQAERPLPHLFDVRAWRIQSMDGAEAVTAPLQKGLTCGNSLTDKMLNWQGVSHIMTPSAMDDSVSKIYHWPLVYNNRELNLAVYEVKNSGPSTGIFAADFSVDQVIKSIETKMKIVPNVETGDAFDRISAGEFFIHPKWNLDQAGRPVARKEMPVFSPPDQLPQECKGKGHRQAVPLTVSANFSRIEFSFEAECPGILTLPWRFLPGWRLTLNGSSENLLMINDLTLGVYFPKGRHTGRLDFWPTTLSFLRNASE